MKIRDMNISARAKSCLLRAGYTDSTEIEGLSDDDLLAIKNLNQNCVDEIRKTLHGDDDNEEANSISFESNIDELKLSIRSYNCLKRAEISTIGELCNLSMDDLKHIRNLGYKYIDEIVKKLDELGFSMKEETDDDEELSFGETPLIPSMETAIDDLGLSLRSYNCLKRAGIDTLGDLCNMTLTDLMKVRNLGRKSCNEVLDILKELGVSLLEQDDDLDEEFLINEYPKFIDVTSSNLTVEHDSRIQIKIEAAYWELSKKLYVPHLMIRVLNVSSSNVNNLKIKALFYNISAKELWDDAYDTIVSGDALKPGYNKTCFLSASVGYANRISESSLPSISAQIFVNDKYYGIVDLDKSYSSKSSYLSITEGGYLTNYSFKKYDEREYGLIVTYNRWEKDDKLYIPSLKVDVINQTLTTKTDISIKAVFYYLKGKKIWSEASSHLITSERPLLPGFKKTAFIKGTQGYSSRLNETSLPELIAEVFVNGELYGQILIKCSYDNDARNELVTIRKDISEDEGFKRITDQDFYLLITTNCWTESGKLYVQYIKIDVTNQQEEPADDIRIKTVFMNVNKKEMWSEVTDRLIGSNDTPLKQGYKKTAFIKATKGYTSKVDEDCLPEMIAEVSINDTLYGEININQSYDSSVVNQELRIIKNKKEEKYEKVGSRDFYPIIQASKWTNVGGKFSIWTGQMTDDLYAPCIQIDVINQKEEPVASIIVKAIFYDMNGHNLWSHTSVNLISSGETPLKQGYRKTAFLNASVGYRKMLKEEELPAIATEIYINNILYGTVMVPQSYESTANDKPLTQGELVFKNDFVKKNDMGFYPVIKQRCWTKNSSIYAPYIRLDIMNQLEEPAGSIRLKAIFYDETKKESWTEASYTAITSSVPLRPGFSVSAFLKGSHGYKSMITTGSLPSLTADIYINDIFYGSVRIKREYDGAIVEEPLVKKDET